MVNDNLDNEINDEMKEKTRKPKKTKQKEIQDTFQLVQSETKTRLNFLFNYNNMNRENTFV